MVDEHGGVPAILWLELGALAHEVLKVRRALVWQLGQAYGRDRHHRVGEGQLTAIVRLCGHLGREEEKLGLVYI